MFKGILTTIYIEAYKKISIEKINKNLNQYYKNKTFVKVLKTNSLISTNDVINTNNCHLSVCKTRVKNKFIILSAIDNLIKGGAGQAVQNMNIKFNFSESEGLK
jgi:N-acetyl-gamma-glutamyl-phosphate reductase